MPKIPPTRPEPRADVACAIADHDRMKASPKRWRACVFVGFQSDGQVNGTTFELRNCPTCASTLAKAAEVRVLRYLRSPRPAMARHAEAVGGAA